MKLCIFPIRHTAKYTKIASLNPPACLDGMSDQLASRVSSRNLILGGKLTDHVAITARGGCGRDCCNKGTRFISLPP